MAKRAKRFGSGDLVAVVDGEVMPEFSDIDISGWTAHVLETKGRGDGLTYIVEWTDDVVQKLPKSFVDAAAEQQMATEFACLPAHAVRAAQ